MRPRPPLVPANKLKREVQAVLTDELRNEKHRNGFGKFDGFAYVAAEAYFHLAGGYAADLHPMQLKYRGKSHWWLLDKDGRVIDMTLGPGEASAFPYERGRRRPFRHTPTGISRRARAIVKRVRPGSARQPGTPATPGSPGAGRRPRGR